MYTFDENIFSDLYKEAYGFRPRGHFFYTSTDEEKQEIWDQTMDAANREMEHEKELKARALEKFRKLVQDTIELGAGDEKTAIRWIIEGQKLTEFDMQYGADFVAWELGLDYHNEYMETIAEVISEIKVTKKDF